MRGAGGMILSYGVLRIDQRHVLTRRIPAISTNSPSTTVDPVAAPAERLPRPLAGPRADPAVAPHTTLAPDFQFDAPVMEAMFTRRPIWRRWSDPDRSRRLAAISKVPVQWTCRAWVRCRPPTLSTHHQPRVHRFSESRSAARSIGDVAKVAFHALIDGDFAVSGVRYRPVSAAAARHLNLLRQCAAGGCAVRFFGASGDLPDPAQQTP